jgi:hypothetical protein
MLENNKLENIAERKKSMRYSNQGNPRTSFDVVSKSQ